MNLLEQYYPESKFGGFTKIDGTVQFYTRVNALLEEDQTLLDFGCGRGEYQDDPIAYRRGLRIFQGKVNKVIGIDVDPSAARNPYLDEFRLMDHSAWPVEDNRVDICICDWVVEHIKIPDDFFQEARRVIRGGGYLCIRTSNLLSPAGIITYLVPNRCHSKILSAVQKDRAREDVFPTYNRCNTPRKIRSFLDRYHFEGVVYTHQAEPAYLHFSRTAYGAAAFLQKWLPSFMKRTILVFARKMDR